MRARQLSLFKVGPRRRRLPKALLRIDPHERDMHTVEAAVRTCLREIRRHQHDIRMSEMVIGTLLMDAAERCWSEVRDLAITLYWEGEHVITEGELARYLHTTAGQLVELMPERTATRECFQCGKKCVVKIRSRMDRQMLYDKATKKICIECQAKQDCTKEVQQFRDLPTSRTLMTARIQ